MSKDKPIGESKPVCFVLMPIADSVGYELGHFGRVYEHLLKPAIAAAGYTPVRADDTIKTDYIVVGIIQKIVESAMNRPGYELTPRSWTNFKGFYEEVSDRVQARDRQEVSSRRRRGEVAVAAVGSA